MSNCYMGTIAKRITLAILSACALALASAAPALAQFDIGKFEVGAASKSLDPYTLAGGHDFSLSTEIEFSTKIVEGKPIPDGNLRRARIELPPGLIGNPQATEHCSEAELTIDECPIDSQLGQVEIFATDESSGGAYPLYNMIAPPGAPAQLGFSIEKIVWVHLATAVRPNGAVSVIADEVSQLVPLAGADTTVWGVPADPDHNPERICHPEKTLGCESSEEEKPFLSLPTSCTGPQSWSADAVSWQQPQEAHSSATQPGNEDCAATHFEPTMTARPTTALADAPSGFDFHLHLPQDETPGGRATAHLRDLSLTLPEGLVVNPASGNGLGACTSAQIGLYQPTAPACPDASKIGSVKVSTPLLADPLGGAVYLAAPYDNPFNSLLAIYTVIEDEKTGILVKIPAKVSADPVTGQLTTTVTDSPQVPVEDLEVHLKVGAAAALRTPATCGDYATRATLTPWSAPESGPPTELTDPYTISQAPDGGPCRAPANTPGFDAGTLTPIAHAYTPFALNLRRPDGSAPFSSLRLTLPGGLLAKLAETPRCPEAALAAAATKPGAVERAAPSCPAASALGQVVAGAGAGPAPYYTTATAYLTGPYKGAPAGVAVIAPALAGPFDLGTIVVRSALSVDPDTGQGTATTDPFPTILQGIVLDLRSVQMSLDKPSFTFNPSSCDEMGISGSLLSALGQPASLFSRFQAAECAALPFKPSLSLGLKGSSKRGGHPALRATLQLPADGADVSRVSVALPHSEFLDTTHIGTICTRVQFAASTCPKASVYGHVKAYAPLFASEPFEGPVYLRSSSNPLPDLVLALHGPPELPASLNLVGRIDSVHGGTRTTFQSTPDVPFSKAVLEMRGGKKGLLLNSRNICKTTNKATVKTEGHNGKVHDFQAKLVPSCKGHKRHGGKRRRG